MGRGGRFSELYSGGETITAVLCNDASIYAARNAIGLVLLPYITENLCLICSLLPSINCLWHYSPSVSLLLNISLHRYVFEVNISLI